MLLKIVTNTFSFQRQADAGEDTNVPGQVLPLTDTANQSTGEATTNGETKPRTPRQPRQRGPPEDGIPSKNKVMVANLPYDLSEEKVRSIFDSTKVRSAWLTHTSA